MFPAGALFRSRSFQTPTITPIRIVPPPMAHRMSNPAVPRPTNPAIPRPTNPAVHRMSNPAIPRPTNHAIPRPTNSAVPRPTNPAVQRPTSPVIPRPTNSAVPRPTNLAIQRHTNSTSTRVVIPETQASNIADVKSTSYYERKEFRRQKREQNAKIHVSIKITNNFNLKNLFENKFTSTFL